MKKKLLTPVLVLCLVCTLSTSNKASTITDEQIYTYCQEIGNSYGIQPELLYSICYHESRCNPNVDNGSCKGLMQVSERWHKDRMEKLGVTDLHDAYSNILVATDYLSELSENREVAEALSVYNGQSEFHYEGYVEDVLVYAHELEVAHYGK